MWFQQVRQTEVAGWLVVAGLLSTGATAMKQHVARGSTNQTRQPAKPCGNADKIDTHDASGEVQPVRIGYTGPDAPGQCRGRPMEGQE